MMNLIKCDGYDILEFYMFLNDFLLSVEYIILNNYIFYLEKN